MTHANHPSDSRPADVLHAGVEAGSGAATKGKTMSVNNYEIACKVQGDPEKPGKLEIRFTQVTQLFGEIAIPPDAARFEMDVEFNDGVRVKLEAREK